MTRDVPRDFRHQVLELPEFGWKDILESTRYVRPSPIFSSAGADAFELPGVSNSQSTEGLINVQQINVVRWLDFVTFVTPSDIKHSSGRRCSRHQVPSPPLFSSTLPALKARKRNGSARAQKATTKRSMRSCHRETQKDVRLRRYALLAAGLNRAEVPRLCRV